MTNNKELLTERLPGSKADSLRLFNGDLSADRLTDAESHGQSSDGLDLIR